MKAKLSFCFHFQKGAQALCLQTKSTAWVKVQDIRNFPFEGACDDPVYEDSEDPDSEYSVHDFTFHARNHLVTVFEKHFAVGFSHALSSRNCQQQRLLKNMES